VEEKREKGNCEEKIKVFDCSSFSGVYKADINGVE
jgi:hypothetical protein